MPVADTFNDTPKGLLTGKTFEFHPAPPERDVLGNPLVVAKLPIHKLPKEDWRGQVTRVLASLNLAPQSATTKLRWRVLEVIESVIVSLGGRLPDQKPGRKGPRKIHVCHPYHLKSAFDLLIQLPEELIREAKFLELLLAMMLRSHTEALSAVNNTPFSFSAEAREYFQLGFKAERLIKNMKGGLEKSNVIQQAYDGYFHGRYYYLFSLIRRDTGTDNTHLFSYFYRAAHFMARIDWDGQLNDKPNLRSLPSRPNLLFYIQRDPAVLERFRTDRAFAEQVGAILKSLPTQN